VREADEAGLLAGFGGWSGCRIRCSVTCS